MSTTSVRRSIHTEIQSGLGDEKHEPGDHQPERPGDVGDWDDRAGRLPALLLEGADEFEGADDEGEPDRDAGPGEPGVEGRRLEHRNPKEDGPRSGEEVAEAFADRDAEVGAERLEDNDGRLAHGL